MMNSLNIKQLKYCRVKLGLRSVSNFGESGSIVEYTAVVSSVKRSFLTVFINK